jgi:transglutaminase-like putative cysteine protease
MKYQIHHRTSYHYSTPVAQAHHLLHLAPRPVPWQRTLGYTLDISPKPALRSSCVDVFGNPMERVSLEAAHADLCIDLALSIEVVQRPWAANAMGAMPWEAVAKQLTYGGKSPLDASRFLFQSPHIKIKHQLASFARECFSSERPLQEAALALAEQIHQTFQYLPASTTIDTHVLEVLERRRGVCQDFAHLMIGSLRALGLSARYVSGYLRTDPPPGQPRLLGVDASHAWVALFVPGVGWVEYDPTNGCLADERHVVIAWGRDFADVSPIRGVIQGGGNHSLAVEVTVLPIE